jgi:hypothetical protein
MNRLASDANISLVCTKCCRERLSTAFHKNPKAKTGRDTRCKNCVNKQKKVKRRQKMRQKTIISGFKFYCDHMPDESLVAEAIRPFLDILLPRDHSLPEPINLSDTE